MRFLISLVSPTELDDQDGTVETVDHALPVDVIDDSVARVRALCAAPRSFRAAIHTAPILPCKQRRHVKKQKRGREVEARAGCDVRAAAQGPNPKFRRDSERGET